MDMKNLIFCLILGLAATAYAQSEGHYTSAKVASARKTLSQVTPVFSYSGTILDGDSTQNLDGQNAGIGAGVLFDIGRSDLVFETGFLYRQMGGPAYLLTEQEAVDRGSTRMAADLELNYAIIPLMGKYYVNGRNDASFFVKGGIQPSLLIFREARLKNPIVTDVKDLSHINDFDLIGAVGGGLQIPLNDTTMFVFDATYIRSFTTVFNNMPLYHNGFCGSVGLGIFL